MTSEAGQETQGRDSTAAEVLVTYVWGQELKGSRSAIFYKKNCKNYAMLTGLAIIILSCVVASGIVSIEKAAGRRKPERCQIHVFSLSLERCILWGGARPK